MKTTCKILTFVVLIWTLDVSATVHLSIDRTAVSMGHSVRVEAMVTDAQENPCVGWLVLPYVNERRWGAHEWTDARGRAVFLLPLPNPGPAEIQVLARPPASAPDPDGAQGAWDLGRSDDWFAGRLLRGEGERSEAVRVQVTQREIARRTGEKTAVGMQWEPWFTPRNAYWQTAQAVPLMGFYDSYNADVTRQHLLWFMEIGVDFILPDWSNHIWGAQHWDERPDNTAEIIHATELTLEVMAKMRDEGLPVPGMVLMPGLSNGPPATIEALNEMMTWLHHHYLRNPRFDGLWFDFDEKPLIVFLDCGAVAQQAATAVDETNFTVRWMSTQLQSTRHDRLGYWTWMDGCLHPLVTYRDGAAEAITVSPAYFGKGGWLYPEARGRRGGTTYIESFRPAIESRPRVILLHQWNEYAGQPEGAGYGENHDIYVDSYSVELSDDIEPVSMTAPGYRGDRGGWGFYYLNLTQALLDLYRGHTEGDTILAVGAPSRGAQVHGDTLEVEWSFIGHAPESFSIRVNDMDLLGGVQGTAATVDLTGIPAGPCTLTVSAKAVQTHYALSETALDTRSTEPMSVQVSIPITLSR